MRQARASGIVTSRGFGHRDDLVITAPLTPVHQNVRLAARSPGTSKTVHALGNPSKALNGVLWGYNQGHVRQVGRLETTYENGQEVDASVVMTENPINSGDSGGPLVNDEGELVGVCSADESNLKVSYFIDVREIKKILNRLDKGTPPTTKP